MVTGALGNRSHPVERKLAARPAEHLTVLNYDRRGRGDSRDTSPYAVGREIEDVEALIDEAGGSAFVYGISSGAILALRATGKFPNKVKKLALYEPPFILDDSRPALPEDYVTQLNEAVAAENRSAAAWKVRLRPTTSLQPPSHLC